MVFFEMDFDIPPDQYGLAGFQGISCDKRERIGYRSLCSASTDCSEGGYRNTEEAKPVKFPPILERKVTFSQEVKVFDVEMSVAYPFFRVSADGGCPRVAPVSSSRFDVECKQMVNRILSEVSEFQDPFSRILSLDGLSSMLRSAPSSCCSDHSPPFPPTRWRRLDDLMQYGDLHRFCRQHRTLCDCQFTTWIRATFYRLLRIRLP